MNHSSSITKPDTSGQYLHAAPEWMLGLWVSQTGRIVETQDSDYAKRSGMRSLAEYVGVDGKTWLRFADLAEALASIICNRYWARYLRKRRSLSLVDHCLRHYSRQAFLEDIPAAEPGEAWAAMVTLTYKDAQDWNPKDITNYISAERKRLERSGKYLGYFWSAELQKRGAIHYHVVWYLKKKHWIRRPDCGWLGAPRLWRRGHSKVDAPLRDSTYAMKYGSKESEAGLPRGARSWGYGGLKGYQATYVSNASRPAYLFNATDEGGFGWSLFDEITKKDGCWLNKTAFEAYPSAYRMTSFDDKGNYCVRRKTAAELGETEHVARRILQDFTMKKKWAPDYGRYRIFPRTPGSGGDGLYPSGLLAA